MQPSRFLTHSQRDARIARVLAAALEAVDPGRVVEAYLREHPLPEDRRVSVLALGKAALAMLGGLLPFVPLESALVITKHDGGQVSKRLSESIPDFRLMLGGHPLPDEASLAAGEAALAFVSALEAEDLLLCLVSGGGSALMSAPLVPLEEMQALTARLLASGAPIGEINLLRRHLDRVKGGGLARATRAHVLSLVLSDVVGNPLEAIASGPTAPDPGTRAGALEVLEAYGLHPGNGAISRETTDSIRRTLSTSPETPKPGDPLFERVQNVIVGDNALAVRAAVAQAGREGFQAESLGGAWTGEARAVGLDLAEKLRVATLEKGTPFCLVAGGETTVTLHGKGRGGRNQELALAAVTPLASLEGVLLVSLATDGEDGPTDAAGAVVTAETLARAHSLGLDPADFLARNDAYAFFERLGDLLRTGPTGTNVNDLTFLVAF